MIEYLAYFFSPSHLFSIQPPALQQRAIIILLVVFGAFIIAGAVSKLSTRRMDALKAKGLIRLYHLLTTMGILGFVYLFFGWQGAALLSARFWLLLWLVTTLVWLTFIIKYLLMDVPVKRKEIDQRRRFEQYLP